MNVCPCCGGSASMTRTGPRCTSYCTNDYDYETDEP